MDVDDRDNLLVGQKLGHVEFKDKDSRKEGTFWMKGKVGKNQLVSFDEGFNVWNAYIRR